MNQVNTQPEAERVEVPEAQRPEQARLRLELSGRWVAWTEDGRRIVAGADDYEAVRDTARPAGVERAVCEWLPPPGSGTVHRRGMRFPYNAYPVQGIGAAQLAIRNPLEIGG